MNDANGASTLVIDMNEFPGLADALSGKGPGDSCKITLDVRIDEITADSLRAGITDAIPEGYKTIEETEEEDYAKSGERKRSPIVAVLEARDMS